MNLTPLLAQAPPSNLILPPPAYLFIWWVSTTIVVVVVVVSTPQTHATKIVIINRKEGCWIAVAISVVVCMCVSGCHHNIYAHTTLKKFPSFHFFFSTLTVSQNDEVGPCALIFFSHLETSYFLLVYVWCITTTDFSVWLVWEQQAGVLLFEDSRGVLCRLKHALQPLPLSFIKSVIIGGVFGGAITIIIPHFIRS